MTRIQKIEMLLKEIAELSAEVKVIIKKIEEAYPADASEVED
jgi:hypothetical protein